MNWESLKENYPKALKKAEQALKTHDHPNHPDYGRIERTRDLYDFFDGEGIACDPGFDIGEDQFDPFVFDEIERKIHWVGSKQERTEAEIAAFTKAFEILEERLNKEG